MCRLEDLVNYNKEHTDLELLPGRHEQSTLVPQLSDTYIEHPNHDTLIGALKSNMTDQQCTERLAFTRHRATSAIKKSLANNLFLVQLIVASLVLLLPLDTQWQLWPMDLRISTVERLACYSYPPKTRKRVVRGDECVGSDPWT